MNIFEPLENKKGCREPNLNVRTLLIGPTAAQISWIPVTTNNNDI